jgi:senataxin
MPRAQGREKDIVIFSCVRAQAARGVGFLAGMAGGKNGYGALVRQLGVHVHDVVAVIAPTDIRRMNVALTRAKHQLFILANPAALERSPAWKVGRSKLHYWWAACCVLSVVFG